MGLLKLYENRLAGVDMDNLEKVLELYENDEKKFYFLLMYYYLSDYSIKFDICTSQSLSALVTLFCTTTDDSEVTRYYSKYTDLSEIPTQIKKIYDEIKLSKL